MNISFPIPLNEDIPADHVRKIGPAEAAPSVCDDDVTPAPSFDRPEADPGYLCVFTSQFFAGGSISYIWKMDTSLGTTEDTGAGRTGALLIGTSSVEDVGTGTFAVTAP